MNSSQLLNMVKSDPCLRQCVKGVFASNTLPQIITQYPSAFIVNRNLYHFLENTGWH